MASVRILHTADWHIGRQNTYLGAFAESRQAEVLVTVQNIIRLCEANSVDVLLVAGDVFDSNRVEPRLVDQTFALLGSLTDTAVVIAAGNHDPYTVDSPYMRGTLPDNVYLLPRKDGVLEFKKYHCRVYGSSFSGVYCEGKPSFGLTPKNDELINLMLLHGETRADNRSVYRSVTPDFIKNSGMDYLALGHVHQRSEIHKIGNTFFAYSGCPEGQGYDETGVKGVWLGDVEKGFHSLEFVPTSLRAHYALQVDMTDCDDPVSRVWEAIRGVSSTPEKDLFRVELIGRIAKAAHLVDPIRADIGGKVYHLRLHDHTALALDYKTISKENTLRGHFVRLCLAQLETAKDENKPVIRQALELGMRSFEGSVEYRED